MDSRAVSQVDLERISVVLEDFVRVANLKQDASQDRLRSIEEDLEALEGSVAKLLTIFVGDGTDQGIGLAERIRSIEKLRGEHGKKIPEIEGKIEEQSKEINKIRMSLAKFAGFMSAAGVLGGGAGAAVAKMLGG